MKQIYTLSLGLIIFTGAAAALAANRIEISDDNDKRCFTANGLPDHKTGTFPNRGNPNAIREQNIRKCITLNPVRNSTPTLVRGAVGIAVNGITFRPGTAGFYDPNGRRGHSRDGDRNWSIDIFGAPGKLGLDFNNAHVGRGGLYHYHGIADSLTKTSGSSLVGYAGDGFEMHYVGSSVTSGYQLKQGKRPANPGPGGKYDGTYNEDYEHISGDGRLDQCNGGELDGKFVYFVTDTYPFVARCLWGDIGKDFAGGEHSRAGRRGRR